jgi:hypothetical protein
MHITWMGQFKIFIYPGSEDLPFPPDYLNLSFNDFVQTICLYLYFVIG